MDLKKLSIEELRNLGFNISREISLPENIIKKREEYIYNKKMLAKSLNWHKNYVAINTKTPLPGYENVVFSHGINAWNGNSNNTMIENINNIDNILHNEIGSHMALSVSKPGEELGTAGVYVTGKVHENGIRDIGTFYRGKVDPSYPNPDISYQTAKKINEINDRTYNRIKKGNLHPRYNDRIGGLKKYLQNLKLYTDPKVFFNTAVGSEQSKVYSESVLSDPKIDSIWYRHGLIDEKDLELLKTYAKENNIPLRPIYHRGAYEFNSNNQIKIRKQRDRFNTHLYNWTENEINNLHDEALLYNEAYNSGININDNVSMNKIHEIKDNIRNINKSKYDDKFSKLINQYENRLIDNIYDEAIVTNKIYDIDKDNYQSYIDKVNKYSGNTFLEKEQNYLKETVIPPSADDILQRYKEKYNMRLDTQVFTANLMEEYKAGNFTQDDVREAILANNSIIKDYQDEVNNLDPSQLKKAEILKNRKIANKQEIAQEKAHKKIQSIMAKREKAIIKRKNAITRGEEAIARGVAKRKVMRQKSAQESVSKILDKYEKIKANNAIDRKEIAQKIINRGKEKRRQKLGEEANNIDKIARKHGTTLSDLERAGNIEIGPDGTITFQLNEEIAASKDKNQNKEKKPNPNKGKNREKQRQLNEERKRKEQERKQKQKESKNKNKSENTNKNQNKKITNTFTDKNADGYVYKGIRFDDGSSVYIKFDANGKITYKTYKDKNKSEYCVTFHDSGSIGEDFTLDNEWAGIIGYNKDLKHIIESIKSNFDLDKAKELRNEADEVWKDLGFGGINDILPDVYYDKPEPEPEPEPDNNTDDSSEDTNSENTDNNNTDDSNNTDTNTDDNSDNTDDSSDEDNNNNTNTNPDNENSNDEGSNDDSNNTNTEQNNSDDENNNNNTNTDENTDNTNTNTNDDGNNNNNTDQNNTSEPEQEQEPEPEPEPPSPDEEPLTDEENSYLKDRANKLKDLYKEKLKELNDLKEEIKNKKEAIKQSKKNGADETLIQKLKDELQDLLKRKKLKQKEVRKAKTKYNNRNTENGLWGDISDINDELSGLDDFVNTTNQSHPDLDKQIKDAINKKEKPEVIKALQELSDKLKNAKDRISNLNMKKSALRKFFTKKYGGKKLKNLSEPQKLKGFGLNELFTLYNTVSTYKDQRREGHGVISSSAKAGTELLLSESLGFGQYMALSLIRELPTATVKGSSAIFKETRRMNSAARFQIFGDADFQDTQQLATMRQSGMELAKMSQYRLEQTLMGNEARYLHK